MPQQIKKFRRISIIALIFCSWVIISNFYGVQEVGGYLADGAFYQEDAPNQVGSDGKFAALHTLAPLNANERCHYLINHLTKAGISHEKITITKQHSNIFVPGNLTDGFLVFQAHYDKDIDYDPNFQAATDNTASVSVLLALINQLQKEISHLPIAFLFTDLEERGLVGATHFCALSERRKYKIDGAICLDMIGRGKTVAATSATQAGFVFRLSPFKNLLFNGRDFSSGPEIFPLSSKLLDSYLKDVPYLKSIVSCTDANAFLYKGIPAIHLVGSDMWHVHQVWGTYKDTVNRVDENSLLQTLTVLESTIKAYAKQKEDAHERVFPQGRLK